MAVERKKEAKVILNTKESLLIPRISLLCLDLPMMTLMQVKENRLRM